MSTTVFIWNNNIFSKKLLGAGHLTIGHASMHITSRWPAAIVTQSDSLEDRTAEYVSWWPSRSTSATTVAVARKNLFADIDCERCLPDHVIRILGLDEQAMLDEWATIRGKKDAHYRMNVKNCSTVVARVLRAGKSLINPYYAHSPMWTPLKAKRLAFSMGGNEMPWPGLLKEMSDAGGITAGTNATYGKMLKRSTRHGNKDTPARYTKDKRGGLASWYK